MGQALIFVMDAFAEIPGDVSRICEHHCPRPRADSRLVLLYNGDPIKRTKRMYIQRTQKAWGYRAHRGWARLLLDRPRDLISHGPRG